MQHLLYLLMCAVAYTVLALNALRRNWLAASAYGTLLLAVLLMLLM